MTVVKRFFYSILGRGFLPVSLLRDDRHGVIWLGKTAQRCPALPMGASVSGHWGAGRSVFL